MITAQSLKKEFQNGVDNPFEFIEQEAIKTIKDYMRGGETSVSFNVPVEEQRMHLLTYLYTLGFDVSLEVNGKNVDLVVDWEDLK